uniref:Eukaryotic translation elongation factor 1 alpha 2 n=1 Tax=Rousettus aegyptiacus TaxID=9407 RepID=A0A7J8DH55_ROUAE|nr:eukaryotic translation elongation factor 1 alpha 2 [Rousettus aegyptiacus]
MRPLWRWSQGSPCVWRASPSTRPLAASPCATCGRPWPWASSRTWRKRAAAPARLPSPHRRRMSAPPLVRGSPSATGCSPSRSSGSSLKGKAPPPPRLRVQPSPRSVPVLPIN